MVRIRSATTKIWMARDELQEVDFAAGSLEFRAVSLPSLQEVAFRRDRTIFDDVQHVAHRSKGGLRIVER